MLLLSIHPRHVESILSGSKRVELRRIRPRIKSGKALIYATAPQMELVASFRIAAVVHAPLSLLWQTVHDVAGVTRREFDAYFSGLQAGNAIHIADVLEFRAPVSLHELRAVWSGFHPPQGFRYLDSQEIAKLSIRGLLPAA